MQIVKVHRVEGAQTARGHVVIVDVLRAFTTLAFAFAGGAERIILVGTPEEALAHRERDPSVLLVGELRGQMAPGFDLGNSPEAIRTEALSGRTLVFRSSNGTQGVVHATHADQILLGSLVVAEATVAFLRQAAPETVTICAMGSSSGKDGLEDTACMDLLAERLAGRPVSSPTILKRVRESGGGRAALDVGFEHITPGDLAAALDIDRFDFAMLVRRESGDLVARPVVPATVPDPAPG